MTDRVKTAAELCFAQDVRNMTLPDNITFHQTGRLQANFEIRFTDGFYAGLTLQFVLIAKESFPFDPPKVRVMQCLFHPNVDATMDSLLNMLRLDSMPSVSLEAIIMSIECMFTSKDDPDTLIIVDVETPLNKEAACLYASSVEEFVVKSRASAIIDRLD